MLRERRAPTRQGSGRNRMTKERPSSIACILGAPRSGTSSVAKLVQELGVYLGPRQHLQMETSWNPEGCWEHRTFLDINVALLSSFGGSPANPPTFPPAWQRTTELDYLRDAARQVVQEDFDGHPVWGWKD